MRVARTALFLMALSGIAIQRAWSMNDTLVTRMRSQLLAAKDYQCDITVNATLPQMTVSNMRVRLYYKRPDKVHIEALEGWAALPKEGLYLGNPLEDALKSCTLRRIGASRFAGRLCEKYAVRPKADTGSPLADVRLFVDKSRAVPAGFTGRMGENGHITTVFHYEKVQGKYWLPAGTILKVSGWPVADYSFRHRSAVRSGQAALKFSNYKINIGLPDSLFTRPKKVTSSLLQMPAPGWVRLAQSSGLSYRSGERSARGELD